MTKTQRDAMKVAKAALELTQHNLRDHGDNCFLHDEGEYNSCFCGKDSLTDHLQQAVDALTIALDEPPPVLSALEQEALQLSSILSSMSSMLEGGYDLDTLYTEDQPDGDPFVTRAGDLLALLVKAGVHPVAEPVGTYEVRTDSKGKTNGVCYLTGAAFSLPEGSHSLYTSPQPLVSAPLLTDEDIERIDRSMCGEREFADVFARAVEAMVRSMLGLK